MTLAFVAFHMRDYQRDTQALTLEGHGAYFLLLQHCWTHGRIPLDDTSRAAICKVTPQRYRKQLAAMVEQYFNENGENKRATIEIEKAEKIRTRQAMAGHKGGIQKALRNAERKDLLASHGQAVAKPRSSHGVAIKNIKQLTPSLEAAREGFQMEPEAANPLESATSYLVDALNKRERRAP